MAEKVMRDSRDLGFIPARFLCDFGQITQVPILKTPMHLLKSSAISGVSEQDRLDMGRRGGFELFIL